MKILVVSAAFPPMPAGEADHAFHVSRHLARRGHHVEVLTTRGNHGDGSGASVHAEMRDWGFSRLPRLARFLRRSAPDAILLVYIGWIYDHHPMITFAPTLARRLLGRRTRFVTQFENAYGAVPHQTSRAAQWARRVGARLAGRRGVDYEFGTLLRDSDGLIVLSDNHRATLAKTNPVVNAKSVLVPPPPLLPIAPEDGGAARRRGRERLGIRDDELLIAYFGFLYPARGVETLLRAFREVRQRRSDTRLALIGGTLPGDTENPTYAERMRMLAGELGIADAVIWTGGYAHDSDEASTYLRAADLAALPIEVGVQLNNSSLSAAVTHGLPTVTTRGAVLESPFVHGENVYLCPPRDPDAMARALLDLLENPDLRARLQAGALGLAGEWFSWDRAVDRTLEALGAA